VSTARTLAVVLVLLAACSRRHEPAAEAIRTTPITAAEAAQVRDACTRYVEHACACAGASATDAGLADQCRLARAIPGALDLALGGASTARGSELDAAGLKANVGKIQKNCVEEDARLELRCPRTRVASPAAPAR
jgi:hypothetical protein